MALTANNNGFFSRHRWLVWAAGIIAAVLLLASFMSRDDAIPVRAATVERSYDSQRDFDQRKGRTGAEF